LKLVPFTDAIWLNAEQSAPWQRSTS